MCLSPSRSADSHSTPLTTPGAPSRVQFYLSRQRQAGQYHTISVRFPFVVPRSSAARSSLVQIYKEDNYQTGTTTVLAKGTTSSHCGLRPVTIASTLERCAHPVSLSPSLSLPLSVSLSLSLFPRRSDFRSTPNNTQAVKRPVTYSRQTGRQGSTTPSPARSLSLSPAPPLRARTSSLPTKASKSPSFHPSSFLNAPPANLCPPPPPHRKQGTHARTHARH